MPKRKQDNGGETLSYMTGLLLGVFISAPIAAWLSPRSGSETRQNIRQRGLLIRHKAGAAVQQASQLPAQVGEKVGSTLEQAQDKIGSGLEQVQDKVGLGKGDSVEEALQEGRAIAAQKKSELGR